MSLESQIERLTAAIEKLNSNIETALNTPVAAPVQPEQPKQADATPPPAEAPALSFKDVQDQCLALSRKDAKNKAVIRALLDEFGASKVSDLGSNLAGFAAKLEQL